MQIGISLQNNWGVEDVQSLVQLARKAEEWGFASVWVHDHVFNAAHVFNRIGTKPYYEPLTLLSYVAACTQRVGLGTSVLVLPYHNTMLHTSIPIVHASLCSSWEGRCLSIAEK
jgi:alkanesulfonate monooxygenase SsuD/methylene tetrahydromethanopterin reductase-like flavin-dependent oxidoreductase (luciferase family)